MKHHAWNTAFDALFKLEKHYPSQEALITRTFINIKYGSASIKITLLTDSTFEISSCQQPTLTVNQSNLLTSLLSLSKKIHHS